MENELLFLAPEMKSKEKVDFDQYLVHVFLIEMSACSPNHSSLCYENEYKTTI